MAAENFFCFLDRHRNRGVAEVLFESVEAGSAVVGDVVIPEIPAYKGMIGVIHAVRIGVRSKLNDTIC